MAALIMYRLLTKWLVVIMFEEGEKIVHLPFPKVEVKPAVPRELIESRELRNDGVKRALATLPELVMSTIPWKRAMTTESFHNLIGSGYGSFLKAISSCLSLHIG